MTLPPEDIEEEIEREIETSWEDLNSSYYYI